MATLRHIILPLIAAVVLAVGSLPVSGIIDGDDLDDLDVLDTVTIARDEYGVPHIYADSTYGLFYANGYVQAQDRLWAMDLLRHLGFGEAASVAGAAVIGEDIKTRRNLYNETQLQDMMAEADPIFLEALQAYSDGVNRAYKEMVATGNMPAEFVALDHAFEQWAPIDTVAAASFLLANFGLGGGDEISNSQLLGHLEGSLGSEADAWAAMEDLAWFKAGRGEAYPTIPEAHGLYTLQPQEGPKTLSGLDPAQKAAIDAAKGAETFGFDLEEVELLEGLVSEAPMPLVNLDRIRLGSNALMVSASLSETGEAMLGGGPQMGYFNPQFPYEVGLHGPGPDGTPLNAVGMGVMGAPGVIIGRNADMAWTVTSGISDQTDHVALPAVGPRSYDWDGQERQLDCRDERHTVYNPPATGGELSYVDQEVCFSHLGPITHVTRDTAGDVAWFFADQTSSRLLEVDSAIKWLLLATSADKDDFWSRLDGFAFTFNFNLAGKDANGDQVACYHHVGLQPVRAPGLDPRFPRPAGDAWDWTGLLTGPDLPRACDPAQGYMANWNNLPQRGWASGDSRELWGSVHRVERLDKAMNDALANDPDGDGLLTLDQVKSVLREAATHDSLAETIVEALLDEDPGTAPAAMTALAQWRDDDFPWDDTVALDLDGDGEDETYYAHPGHTVYDRVLQHLVSTVFEDELGAHTRGVNLAPFEPGGDPHAGDHGQHNNPFSILVNAFDGEDQARNWCDDVTTLGVVESCSDALAAALAAANLTGASTLDGIELTEEHRSPFTSLGAGPAYTMPMTNRATYYHFHVGSDVDESYSALSAGQSGHLTVVDLALIQAGLSDGPEHMKDQKPLYEGFGFKHLPWTQEQAEATAESVETLVVPRVPGLS